MNNLDNTSELTIMNWLILGCVFIIFIVLQLIRRESAKLSVKAAKHIDLPSNYSMMLRRLPKEYKESDILDMIEKRRA